MGRVGPGVERRHQVRAAPDQVDLHLGGGQPAADEERAAHVHAGEVGRVDDRAAARGSTRPASDRLARCDVELGARLDLERGGVERDLPAEHGVQWITGHPRRVASVRNAAGSLFGLAYGDALGQADRVPGLRDDRRPLRPGRPARADRDAGAGHRRHPDGARGRRGACWPRRRSRPRRSSRCCGQAFLAWAMSPDNNRAPGMTCLRACAALADGRPLAGGEPDRLEGLRGEHAGHAGRAGPGAERR